MVSCLFVAPRRLAGECDNACPHHVLLAREVIFGEPAGTFYVGEQTGGGGIEEVPLGKLGT